MLDLYDQASLCVILKDRISTCVRTAVTTPCWQETQSLRFPKILSLIAIRSHYRDESLFEDKITVVNRSN